MKQESSITTSSLLSNQVLYDLVEELTDRCGTATREEIEEFLSAHPDHADQLRQLIPALQALADFSQSGASVPPVNCSQDKEELPGTLGDFQILHEIGRGGMGVVYEAYQLSLNRRIALKVLPFASMLDPRHLLRFKNEAMAAAQLDHPHIVHVHATGCERGVHYYAMQFIEGDTLAALIAELQKGDRKQKSDVRSQQELDRGRSAEPDLGDTPRLGSLNSQLSTLNPPLRPAQSQAFPPSIHPTALRTFAGSLSWGFTWPKHWSMHTP